MTSTARQARQHSVIGSGGLRLYAQETGPSDAPPILFVHGWSQCHLSWKKQLASPLADKYRLVAVDLRGHGASELATDDASYQKSEVWAEDVAAVVSGLGLERPILVGWSLGGYIVCDYLRHVHDAAPAGVVMVGSAVRLGPTPADLALIGNGWLDHFADAVSPDLATSLAAIRAFVDACVAGPLPAEDREEMLCYNALVAPSVRAASGTHEPVDNSDILSSLDVPLMVAHGAADRVFRPESVELVRAANPRARISVYDGVGHAPFLEDPDRFNRELDEFASLAWTLPKEGPIR